MFVGTALLFICLFDPICFDVSLLLLDQFPYDLLGSIQNGCCSGAMAIHYTCHSPIKRGPNGLLFWILFS